MEKLDRCLSNFQASQLSPSDGLLARYTFDAPTTQEAILGEGGHAKAFRMRDRRNGALPPRCVKFINKKRLGQRAMNLRHLAAELACTISLPQHPNVNQGIEVLYDDENIYLVLELVAGIRPDISTRMYELCHRLNPSNITSVLARVQSLDASPSIRGTDEDRLLNEFKASFLGGDRVHETPWSGDLYEYIVRNGAVGEARAKSIIKQCLLAVKHLHDNRFVHRDVKVENFVIATQKSSKVCRGAEGRDDMVLEFTERIRVVLIDFGLCKYLDLPTTFDDDVTPAIGHFDGGFDGPGNRASIGSVDFNVDMTPAVGTPVYEAFESIYARLLPGAQAQWSSKKSDLPKLDIWGIGTVMFCLMNGCPPFKAAPGPQQTVQLARAIRQPLKYKSWVSTEAREIMNLMFQRDPQNRPSAAQLLEMPFFQGVSDTVVTEVDVRGTLRECQLLHTPEQESEMEHMPSVNGVLRVLEEGKEDADSPAIEEADAEEVIKVDHIERNSTEVQVFNSAASS